MPQTRVQYITVRFARPMLVPTWTFIDQLRHHGAVDVLVDSALVRALIAAPGASRSVERTALLDISSGVVLILGQRNC